MKYYITMLTVIDHYRLEFPVCIIIICKPSHCTKHVTNCATHERLVMVNKMEDNFNYVIKDAPFTLSLSIECTTTLALILELCLLIIM
jgi:hypothetical protein